MDLPQPGMRLNSQPLLNTVPKLLTFDALFLQILAPFVRMLERDWYWGERHAGSPELDFQRYPGTTKYRQSDRRHHKEMAALLGLSGIH